MYGFFLDVPFMDQRPLRPVYRLSVDSVCPVCARGAGCGSHFRKLMIEITVIRPDGGPEGPDVSSQCGDVTPYTIYSVAEF